METGKALYNTECGTANSCEAVAETHINSTGVTATDKSADWLLVGSTIVTF